MNVLLDLDGTLTDPRAGFVASIRYALQNIDCEAPSDDDIAKHIGPPLEETFAKLLGATREHQIGAAVNLYRNRYSSTGIFENAVYEGIPHALNEIQSFGFRIYLATSKPQVFAIRILEHFSLSQFFTAVYGSELDGTRSDKRSLIAYILQQESFLPTSAVMVGDRSHDVKGALFNAVSPVGVLWGYGTLAELTEAGATIFVEHPSQLAQTLLSNIALK